MTNDDAFTDIDLEDHDLELYRRVRAAIRAVPPQDAQEADEARRRALTPVAPPQRQRMWMATAAAAVVGVLGVVAFTRFTPSSEPAADAVIMVASSEAAPVAELRMADVGPAGALDLDDLDLVSLREVVRSANAIAPTCAPAPGEQSYGLFEVADRSLEIHADQAAGVLRLIDPLTCETLALTDL
jgi:hypothetical protein